ncbi:PqqD family protein [Nitratifractor sp.]|uniref:PqqD family protein n=1 Tax=Nitratifractor sp. TaxID=2268144 RepID=UPI0025E12E6E|nr:PqqD family protein [Nitratifractor sp.]
MDFSKKVNFSDAIFAQEVDGEMVLLDMNSENYFGLDAVASDIWRLLQEGKTLQETEEALLEIYDAEAEQVHKDLEAFVEKLIESGLASLG